MGAVRSHSHPVCFFFLMIRRPPRSTRKESSAASDVYKRQTFHRAIDESNTIDSVKILKDYDKITNILTSGGKGSIVNN
ncbi:hypothetical protein CDFC105_43975 [Clostridioides difficile]|nr:hypothetical protein CDFC105_43975 [Clostridioides difficile]